MEQQVLGGGGTFVFKEIPSITDNRYQFTKGTINYEVLLVAGGGGGTNDASYQGTATNGSNGIGATWYSPSNHIAWSTYTSNPATSNSNTSVSGINQFITYDAAGRYYTRSSGIGRGGYGARRCSR